MAALLAACPGLRIIATSRERLHLRAEQRYRVEPLPVDDAISLFLGAVALAAPDFAAGDADRPVLEQLCLELDCLPLALELAAAQLEFEDVASLLRRLRSQRLDVLTGGPGDLPERQRALRLAIADSYDRLQPGEQTLFRLLGLFVGGFDAEAVAALGFAASDLGALTRTHLAHRLGGAASRFGMLETLRAFALERLAAGQELVGARRRHGAYFLGLVEQAEPALHGPEQTGWFHRLVAEIHNLRAAIQHALEDGELATAARLCVGLRHFWTMQSHLEEGRLWLDRVLASGKVGDLEPRLHTRLLNSRGTIAFYQQDDGEARKNFGKALALANETGDEWAAAFALDGLGAEAANRGDYAGAAAYSARSLALSQAGGHTWLSAITLVNLGEIARLQGDDVKAAARYEEGLGLLRQVGDGSFTAVTLINLAQLAINAEDWQRARALACESLQLGVRTEQPRTIAHSLDKLAAVAAGHGDPLLAGKLFGAAQRLRDEHSITIQPADRDDYARLIDTARVQSDPDDFETALRAGYRLPLNDAVALVL
ncbi:MAG: tetratricopeptide repeat protein [Caldilineales bacterium]|nr:tetratricopeptide repeat protein [Caldilineales bacterium]MCW5858705.1 tetratricopeptide repeat protein [Caldilineales bacterium]